jgi:hypothetical protein
MRLSRYKKNMRDDTGTIYTGARIGLLTALAVVAVAAVLGIALDSAELDAQLIRAKEGVPPPAFDARSRRSRSTTLNSRLKIDRSRPPSTGLAFDN